MPDTTNRLKALLSKLRDAALSGAQDRPSTEELISAASELPIDEGIAAIEEVFLPTDNLILLDAGQQVNARQYLREMLFISHPSLEPKPAGVESQDGSALRPE